MAKNFYGALGLTGGVDGDLDFIDGAGLADGDGAFVVTSGKSYTYTLNDSSGASESIPDVISPDTNPGTKRWILVPPETVLARVAGSTYSTVQHLQDIFHSAGWVSGGAVTDDGDGTITVALGTGLIRATDTAVAEILFMDWAAESGTNVAVADNDISYVYVEYFAGSPRAIATITERTDFNTNVLLAVVSREGTDIHINQTDQHTVGDHANSMIRRLKGTMPYGHVSGGILSETGTRNIDLTAGSFWRGLTPFATSAVNTSGAPTFDYYYNNGSWQKVAAQSTIHQTNWNDFGTGLDTLSNNKYGVHWVYLQADDERVSVVYGIGDYTLSQAENAQPPSALPQHLQMVGILAGKIIIKESAVAFTQVESAFQTKFVGAVATEHNNTSGLQGGTTDEYYHLTEAEHTGVGGGDEKVGIDAAAAPGYLGVASGDGVLRTGAGMTYTDGGDFVTLKPDLVGDNTAGRVIRSVRLTIQNGTNANTLKCSLVDTWNG
ncbi:hypothetical protein LCGC14_0561250, partial [marine sediment metagenome]